MYIYIYICIHTHNEVSDTGVCEKTLLRKIIHTGISAFRARSRGRERSLCCWTAGQGLAQK